MKIWYVYNACESSTRFFATKAEAKSHINDGLSEGYDADTFTLYDCDVKPTKRDIVRALNTHSE